MSATDYQKIVIVTGCASGIGQSAAKKYIKEGFCLIGLDIAPCAIDGLDAFIRCDLSNESDLMRASAEIKRRYRSVNYLICCAGIFFDTHRSTLSEMDRTEWEKVLSCNLTGSMLVFREILPLLVSAQGDKAVVFISSDQAEYPRMKNSAYAVSKGGLKTLAKACAAEGLEYGVRVNCIEPASVRTNFIRKLAGSDEHMAEIYEKTAQGMPLGLIEPEDIAELIFFFGSEHAKCITGQSLMIDSGSYL